MWEKWRGLKSVNVPQVFAFQELPLFIAVRHFVLHYTSYTPLLECSRIPSAPNRRADVVSLLIGHWSDLYHWTERSEELIGSQLQGAFFHLSPTLVLFYIFLWQISLHHPTERQVLQSGHKRFLFMSRPSNLSFPIRFNTECFIFAWYTISMRLSLLIHHIFSIWRHMDEDITGI